MKGDFPYVEQYCLSQMHLLPSRFGFTNLLTDLIPILEKEWKLLKLLTSWCLAIWFSVLDEVNVAAVLGLINIDDIINHIKENPDYVEQVITGRSDNLEL